jgi:formylmethanofuran dehydrogenase subunit E
MFLVTGGTCGHKKMDYYSEGKMVILFFKTGHFHSIPQCGDVS